MGWLLGKSLIELVANRVNGRVPLIVAGFLRTPDDLTSDYKILLKSLKS